MSARETIRRQAAEIARLRPIEQIAAQQIAHYEGQIGAFKGAIGSLSGVVYESGAKALGMHRALSEIVRIGALYRTRFLVGAILTLIACAGAIGGAYMGLFPWGYAAAVCTGWAMAHTHYMRGLMPSRTLIAECEAALEGTAGEAIRAELEKAHTMREAQEAAINAALQRLVHKVRGTQLVAIGHDSHARGAWYVRAPLADVTVRGHTPLQALMTAAQIDDAKAEEKEAPRVIEGTPAEAAELSIVPNNDDAIEHVVDGATPEPAQPTTEKT